MAGNLQGRKVAILAADMVEEAELIQLRQALCDAGVQVEIVSLDEGEIQSFHDLEVTFGERYKVDTVVKARE